MLRRMTVVDVPTIVNIHKSSWSPDEISVKLGEPYLTMFYSSIAAATDAFTYLYEHEGKIIGYATGFENYRRFNKRMRNSNLLHFVWIIASRLLRGRLTTADIRNMFNDSLRLRKLRFPDVHWGATALANECKGTPLGREALLRTVQAVFRDLELAGNAGCWGACDDKNTPMKKWLVRLGFKKVDTVQYIGRDIVVYEKIFDQDNRVYKST